MTSKEIKQAWNDKKATGYLLELSFEKNKLEPIPIVVHHIISESSNKNYIYTRYFALVKGAAKKSNSVFEVKESFNQPGGTIAQNIESNLKNYESISQNQVIEYVKKTFEKYDLYEYLNIQKILKSLDINISDSDITVSKEYWQAKNRKKTIIAQLKQSIQDLKKINENLKQKKVEEEKLKSWSKNAVDYFEQNKIVFDEKKGLHKQDSSDSEVSQSVSVQDIELSKIHTDPARFQNRQNEFSSESRDRIVNAYKNGEFDFAKFDPISIWKDPNDNKFYVLSGHSRFAAFKEIAKLNKKFEKIPSRIFNGTEKQAIDFALNSNVLSTKETDMERAIYYHKDRQTCEIAKHVNGLGDVIDCEKQTELKCRENEGKNAPHILNLSYLNPEGFLADSMKRIGADKGNDDANIIRTVADWVGDIRKRVPEVSDSQETEIAKYLLNGGYGSKSTQFKNKEKFILRFRYCFDRWKQRGADPQISLNLANSLSKSVFENEYDQRLEEARIKRDAAKAEYEEKHRKYWDEVAYGRMTQEKMLELEKPLIDYYNRCLDEYKRIMGTKEQVKAAASAQMSLFGLSGIKLLPTHEIGEFGTIYTEFKNQPVLAIKHLMKVKEGECISAFYRKDIGYVDLVWGYEGTEAKEYSDGYGLAHIIKKHEKEINEINFNLEYFIPIAFSYGNLRHNQIDSKIFLENGTCKVVIKTKWSGKNKRLILTAFDLRPISKKR